MKSLTIVIAILLGGVSTEQASAKKFEYSPDFSGNRRGTYTVVADGTGVGTIAARVKVPRSGQSMKVVLSGFVSASGTSIPIGCTLRFDSRGKIRSDAALLGLYGPVSTSNARLKGSDGKYRFTLSAAPGAALLGNPVFSTVNYQFRLKKKSLAITGTGSIISGVSVPISYSFRAR